MTIGIALNLKYKRSAAFIRIRDLEDNFLLINSISNERVENRVDKKNEQSDTK